MKFKLEINCDNAAFEDGREEEVATILENITEKIRDGFTSGYARDSNGNTVGTYAFRK